MSQPAQTSADGTSTRQFEVTRPYRHGRSLFPSARRVVEKPGSTLSPGALMPPKRQGLAHLLASTGYSIQGLKRLSSEAAFRQELVGAAIVLALHGLIGSAPVLWLAQAVLLLLLFALEALNTAIEEIADRVSPGYSEMARNAKDLGSLAVLFVLAANGVCFAAAILI